MNAVLFHPKNKKEEALISNFIQESKIKSEIIETDNDDEEYISVEDFFDELEKEVIKKIKSNQEKALKKAL
ncbi:MAG: hypothetical protein KA174_11400 [Chitinophagales bacterium]|nr:hypothetical protein [Saprospirales bacterium]MBK8352181.1 hypothetical protein [Saprospirales bacterium]MBP6661281.1 hypothetical protein [Chitinophagales bacterium]